MGDAAEKNMLEKIIEAVREVPEEELDALYDVVVEFRRNLDDRSSRWADFTGILSDDDASSLLDEPAAEKLPVDTF